MIKTSLGTLLTVGLAAGAMTPATSNASPAAWCKGVPDDTLYEGVDKALAAGPAEDAVLAIAQSLCHPTDDARRQRDAIEAARLRWMKRMGMTEADWATDVVAFASADSTRSGASVTVPDATARWSTLSPIGQFGLLAQSSGASDSFALGIGTKHYVADALPLSETGRLAYIQYCLAQDDHPAVWAMCQGDIEALDRGKLARELRAAAAPAPIDKMLIRFALVAVDAQLPAHAARIEAHGEAVAVAAAARKQWQTGAPARSELLALVGALDDARATKSKQDAKRCDTALWPRFAAAIAALSPGAFDGLKGNPAEAKWFGREAIALAVQHPDVYLAANALVSCQSDVSFRGWIQEALKHWPGARGPRTAAATALVLANLDLKPLDIRIPYALREAPARKRATVDPGRGIVAAVATQGDAMTVTMKSTRTKEQRCTQWKRTNRITRITSDGTLEYEERCLGYRQVTVDTTPGPYTFAAAYGGAVAKGQYVEISEYGVEGVWAKPDAERPLAVLGVTLRTK